MTDQTEQPVPPKRPAWTRRGAAILAAALIVVLAGIAFHRVERLTRPVVGAVRPGQPKVSVPPPPGAQKALERAGEHSSLRRYTSPEQPEAIERFYRTAMARQGWREISIRGFAPERPAPEDVLAFARRPQLCIISLSRSGVDPGTTVTVLVRAMARPKGKGPPYERKRP